MTFMKKVLKNNRKSLDEYMNIFIKAFLNFSVFTNLN